MKLSIVLAVYNEGMRVGTTLDSILAQTEGDFEIVIIDDGSTDSTPSILADYAKRDARIRVVTQPNRGLTEALIRGCAEARAPLIARHDSGDRSHPERFARQIALFADPETVLTGTSTRVFGPGGELLYTVNVDGEVVRQSLLHDRANQIRSLPHHGTAIFRRSAYVAAGGYRAEFRVAQDVDLWVRMAKLGRIVMLPNELYDVTFHPGGISGVARAAQVRATELIVALRDGAGDERALLDEAARIVMKGGGRRGDVAGLYFIARCLRAQRNPSAREYPLRVVRRNPLHWRAWVSLMTGR